MISCFVQLSSTPTTSRLMRGFPKSDSGDGTTIRRTAVATATAFSTGSTWRNAKLPKATVIATAISAATRTHANRRRPPGPPGWGWRCPPVPSMRCMCPGSLRKPRETQERLVAAGKQPRSRLKRRRDETPPGHAAALLHLYALWRRHSPLRRGDLDRQPQPAHGRVRLVGAGRTGRRFADGPPAVAPSTKSRKQVVLLVDGDGPSPHRPSESAHLSRPQRAVGWTLAHSHIQHPRAPAQLARSLPQRARLPRLRDALAFSLAGAP